MKTYDQAVLDFATITNDSSFSPGVFLNMGLHYIMNLADWDFNKTSFFTYTVASQQAYLLPYNIERINYVNVYANGINYTPTEIKDGKVWQQINYVNTVFSDVPLYWFHGNATDQVQIYPIPSSAGNIITVGYTKKKRNFADVATYNTGKVSTNGTGLLAGDIFGAGADKTTEINASFGVLVGSNGASWDNTCIGQSIKITSGVCCKGLFFEIVGVSDSTHLYVKNFLQETITNSAYTINEMIPLLEGFEDLLIWFAVDKYYQMKEMPDIAQQYEKMWRDSLDQMKARDQRSVEGILKKETPVGLTDPNSSPWCITLYPIP